MVQESVAEDIIGPEYVVDDEGVDLSGSMYLPLRFGRVSVMGLIDTGATVSVVHPTVFAKIARDTGAHLEEKESSLRLADGSSVDVLGVARLSFCVGSGSDAVEHMLKVACIEAPVVIELDFLRAQGCV